VIKNESLSATAAPYVLFAWPPGDLARVQLLIPNFGGYPSDSIGSACTLLQGLLDTNGEGFFTRFFTSAFFQAPILRLLLLVLS
jgi:hypothetical protein